jgi:hypothetical protein
VAPTKRKYGLGLVIIGGFAWLLIDGGVGRVMAIVGIATIAICGVLIWLAKKFAGSGSI